MQVQVRYVHTAQLRLVNIGKKRKHMEVIDKSERRREQRREQRKRAKERRHALGLPIARTEQAIATRKAAKKRYKERYKEKLMLQRINVAPEIREKRRLRAIECAKAHRQAHRDYYRVINAIKKGKRRYLFRESNDFDKFVFVEAHYLRLLRDTLFGFSWHVDHIIPISKGGTNAYDNIQVVPAIWNMKKGNRNSEKYINI